MSVIVLMNTIVFFAHIKDGDFFLVPILGEVILVIGFVYVLSQKELLS